MTKIQRGWDYFRSFFPSKLPTGLPEFDAFANSIIEIYGLPNFDSYRQLIATLIMHLPPMTHSKSKRYFYAAIKKSMSNETAYAKIQEYKESSKKKSEDTPAEVA